MVRLDPKKPVLLIDTSYYIFYRYFAVYNWYKMAEKKVIDVPHVLSNTQFMTKFDKLFEDNLEKLRKPHNVAYTNIVFVKDCMRDHIWRYKHFASYKKSREERLETFNGDIFKYCYNTLIPRLQEKMGIQTCDHNCSEADDIIAVFTRHIRKERESCNIVIVTNDNDYLQLIQDRVTIVNMKNVNLKERLQYTPELYLRIKIIMGDKSDNIPSIFPKCGEKKAFQLAENDELLEERFQKIEGSREKFELNTLLIDTLRIPENIQTEIVSLLRFTDQADL